MGTAERIIWNSILQDNMVCCLVASYERHPAILMVRRQYGTTCWYLSYEEFEVVGETLILHAIARYSAC